MISRRALLGGFGAGVALGAGRGAASAQAVGPDFSYPMGLPGRALGDGFYVRVAYAAENSRYYPGWWHTGENWHRQGDDTAGLPVFAVAEGEVVFVGYDYPGRVVIVQHADGLYSMYGHLDYAVAVQAGQRVARGHRLGTVLARADDYWRSHLHFELRTFLSRAEINGDAPQHGVTCGYQCPPGPGYWPMSAPEHPSDLGWLNPTHVINRRAWPGGVPDVASVIVAEGASPRASLWSEPGAGEPLGDLVIAPGETFRLRDLAAGEEAATGTSSEASLLWYRIASPDGMDGWVQAAHPDTIDAGADGRPSSLRFDFVPLLTI